MNKKYIIHTSQDDCNNVNYKEILKDYYLDKTGCYRCGESLTNYHKCPIIYWTEEEIEEYQEKLRELVVEWKNLKKQEK